MALYHGFFFLISAQCEVTIPVSNFAEHRFNFDKNIIHTFQVRCTHRLGSVDDGLVSEVLK